MFYSNLISWTDEEDCQCQVCWYRDRYDAFYKEQFEDVGEGEVKHISLHRCPFCDTIELVSVVLKDVQGEILVDEELEDEDFVVNAELVNKMFESFDNRNVLLNLTDPREWVREIGKEQMEAKNR